MAEEELLEKVRKAAHAYMLSSNRDDKRSKLRELNNAIAEAKSAGVEGLLINNVICEELMCGHG